MVAMIVPVLISIFLGTATLAIAEPAAAAPAGDASHLTVATFNIRYGKANDGDDAWDKRRDLFMRTFKSMDADLIGMQEVLAFQLDEIKTACPQYTFISAGRDDGRREGESSPVGFKTDRFEAMASGTFWLSETPEKVGSKGWDAALPRVATWARLKDRKSGETLLFIGTHFDHKGKEARANAAKLLRSRVEAMRDGVPVIVVGDFNAPEGSAPYKNLLGAEGDANHLVDSFREAHPQRGPDEGTFNGFKGKRDGDRIDWIVHTTDVKAVSCEIVRDNDNGRYPSDHFAVRAVVQFRKREQR
jgi:endonuclease/exonuclease/phosphatase family metal-dependent hydrolase